MLEPRLFFVTTRINTFYASAGRQKLFWLRTRSVIFAVVVSRLFSFIGVLVAARGMASAIKALLYSEASSRVF
jgi:hypothetical protein